jgi:hypothetical protein
LFQLILDIIILLNKEQKMKKQNNIKVLFNKKMVDQSTKNVLKQENSSKIKEMILDLEKK